MGYFINSSDINQTFVMLPTNGFDSNTTININGETQDLSANREWRVAQGDTGCLTFDGLTFNTTTTIDIGSVTGYIIDNETNPAVPSYQYINYSGETNKFVPTLNSGLGTFILLDNSGISFQNTFPTSTERKAKIWLGKVGHPENIITTVINEPDYITSPMAFSRDMFQAVRYINDGVYPYANGNNLKVNITSGSIHGSGINFTNDRTNPNKIQMGPNSTGTTFFYRTQTGGTFSISSEIDPTIIDVDGMTATTTGITLQYIFCVPNIGFVIQFGQKSYANLALGVAAIGRESFVIYQNLVDNAILIGVLAVNSSSTNLSNIAEAIFFRADKFGQTIGAQAGTSITNLQSAYINSLAPQITTNETQGAVQIKGWGNGMENVFQTQNSDGTPTFNINENGFVTGNGFSVSGASSSQFLKGDGSIDSTTYENINNKTDVILGNETSSSLYSSIKGVIDYLKESIFTIFNGKTLLVDGDTILVGDSEDSFKTKIISWANIISSLFGKFDSTDQIEVGTSQDIQTSWNGKVILFTANCTITIPSTLPPNFSFQGGTLDGVNVSFAIMSPKTFLFGPPTAVGAKTTFSLLQRGGTNSIIIYK